MRKLYCDKCAKEIEHCYQMHYHIHIENIFKNTISGYVDNNGDPISGRQEYKELCLSCYNKCMHMAMKEFYNNKER